ncbi:poly(ADP-ribose) polymerase family member 14-related sequence 1 isoform X2 [Carcharodon carcharias]|uniref:poly(ADP-ribose) polymerase family member 14-related sequence 1 isoform X2 n=1 Tax=Carcharodon carcharias TaxID=13397 RepID=UPI001B7F29C1|nr:poly(ADP-ribose) polymerase family member 14-related sequence 1 isoform X2 [Carcharodon carcharias]
MATEADYPYPLLIEGDWGPDIAKLLKTKLQVYFQSRKKSNGGDCIVEYEDLVKGKAVVRFATEETRCCVLEKEAHEIDLQKRGKVHFTVRPLPQGAAGTDWAAATQLTPEQYDLNSVRKQRTTEQDAQAALNQQTHSVARGLHDEGSKAPQQSSAVALKNLPKNIPCDMLNLLVENYTGLSEEDDNFSLEVLREINVAVVTFKTDVDITEFIKRCSKKVLSNQQNIVAEQLEITTSVRVENLPSHVSEDLLKLYFENSRNGCGNVTTTELIPEDNIAVVTFENPEVLNTILAKTHTIDKTPIYIYPYYKSLGSALYGNKRPVVKMPDPFTFDIDPYILKILKSDRQRIAEINDKMSKHHCNIALPDSDLSNSVKIFPTFSRQESSLGKLVKNWKKVALGNLTGILLKYKTVENNVSQQIWEIIRGDLDQYLNQNVAVILEISKGKVIVTGESGSVDTLQRALKSAMDRVIEKLEQEKQSVTVTVACKPAENNLLLSTGLEKHVSTLFPNLSMQFNSTTGQITLHGLCSDVYAAKSNILERVLQMKQKQINMNPQLIGFLQRLDHNEVSCCLFISNGINAVYDIKDNCVLLLGNTDISLTAAEQQIKKHLSFKCIDVEDLNVTRMREWAQLKEKLNTKLNSPSEQVEMEETPLHGHMQIIIAGYSNAVMEAFEMLSDFVKKNTIIQKHILFKSGGVLKFLMDVKKIDLFQAPPKDIKIKVNNMANGVVISGPQENVYQVENLLLDAASRVISSVLKMTKPGINKIFKEKEDMYVTTVMHKFECVLTTIKHGVFGDNGELGQAHCKVQLPLGPLVTAYKGDLCKIQVDVVVNAANEDLQHIGGLAGALLKAAGPILQNDCNWIVNHQGALMPGDAVITDAGNLPCSKVIHAVGPRWMQTNADTAKKCLRKAVKQSLCLAESHNLKTIAIPAISSGIFGFPLPLCAEIIVRSIREHCVDSQGGSALKEIHLVNHDEQTVHAVSGAVQKILGEFLLRTPVQPERLNIDSRTKNTSISCLHKAQTKEGLNVIVDNGNIQHVTVGVIVNVIGMDFDLTGGAVSQALLEKAGPKLQALLLNEKHSKKHAMGRIYETKGCNLNCEEVFHVVAPPWDKGKGGAEKLLRNIIKDCLKNTEALQLNSIAFPAIGTGKLGFPKELVATLMFEKVLNFSSKRHTQHLKNVHFVVHPDDIPTLQAMSREFEKTFLSQPKRTHLAAQQRPTGPLFGRVTSAVVGQDEIQVGPILLQVITGDITKETTDAIVNSTNNKFTLKAGVSKAVLDAAGQTVADKCEELGQGQANPTQVADAMIDSVGAFVNRKSPTSLQKIRIVIFQPQMFKEFHSSLQKHEGSILPETGSLWNKAKNVVTELIFGDPSKEKKQHVTEGHIIFKDQIEPVLFEVCGDNRQTVENAKSWMECLILMEHDEKIISTDYLIQLSAKEDEELRTLQRNLQIAIELKLKQSGSQIKVFGAAKDVLTAYSVIQEMVNNHKEKEHQRRDEELFSNIVEWQLEYGTQFVPFDSATNFTLEQAFREHKTETVIEMRNRKYVVKVRMATASDNQGNIIKLKRVLKTEGLPVLDIPNHWDDMQKLQYRSVLLQQQSQEYQDVEASIKRSLNQIHIMKIERLQNPCLWKNYMIRKQLLEEKNPSGTINEKILFHGTAQNTLNSISHHGFNRSYAGRNATAYGNGTYFAVDASYSAAETYARIDANGLKHMYRARVLTGVYCRGIGGMVTPPPKNAANPTDLYDSVVDNEQRPSMFIIFNDIQAYPEYLITFKSQQYLGF